MKYEDYISVAAAKAAANCPRVTFMPADPQLAMAYVPYQPFERVYEPEQAFARGTLFPDLDKPFLCGRGEPR